MNWFSVAIAAVVPLLVAVPIAALLWKRRQLIVGNAIGALVLFMGFLVFGGIEYVDAMAYRKRCQALNLPCPISDPSDFVRIMVFGIVAMVQIMVLFLASDMVEVRTRKNAED